MVKKLKQELLAVTTNHGIIQAEQAGLIKEGLDKAEILQAVERGGMMPVSARILTQISKENINIMRQVGKRVSEKHLNMELRDVNSSLKLYPHFYIIDEEEALFFITPKEDSSVTKRHETGLWTNSEAFVCTLKAFFEDLWHDAKDINEKIREIETENR